MISSYLEGLGMVFQFGTLLAIAAGTLLGIVMGALPGLTSAMAIALLLPATFGMPPVMGIGMLLGALCGSGASGSIPAILLNIPGTPSSVATTFDGYPMAQKGEAGRALGLAIVASSSGGAPSTWLRAATWMVLVRGAVATRVHENATRARRARRRGAPLLARSPLRPIRGRPRSARGRRARVPASPPAARPHSSPNGRIRPSRLDA